MAADFPLLKIVFYLTIDKVIAVRRRNYSLSPFPKSHICRHTVKAVNEIQHSAAGSWPSPNEPPLIQTRCSNHGIDPETNN